MYSQKRFMEIMNLWPMSHNAQFYSTSICVDKSSIHTHTSGATIRAYFLPSCGVVLMYKIFT